LDTSPVDDGNAAKPVMSSPTLARHDSQSEDDHITNGPPHVSTSEHVGTLSSEGGRFISNTFSYHSGDTLAINSVSGADQKIYRCEDEP
jgi:hypothetical protein